jgi:hypothetical protein
LIEPNCFEQIALVAFRRMEIPPKGRVSDEAPGYAAIELSLNQVTDPVSG